MESILETKAITLVQFLQGLRGELHVTLEEGTWAAWLYDVLQPRVQEVVVCDPRRNALLKEGRGWAKFFLDLTPLIGRLARPRELPRTHWSHKT